MTISDATPALVGNDVVDLRWAKSRHKLDDARFLDRVFSVEERDLIQASRDPEHTLWLLWAAKESAFKVVSKRRGGAPVFAHASFRVTLVGTDRGRVDHEDDRVPWAAARADQDLLHVVAWSADDRKRPAPVAGRLGGSIAGAARLPSGAGVPRERLGKRELESVHGPASAWVRIHARRHLARLMGEEEDAVAIVCEGGPAGRTPPRALIHGEPSAWDVSLSHHKGWLGWALRRRA